MSTKKPKVREWIVININEGIAWFAIVATPEEAIEAYLVECACSAGDYELNVLPVNKDSSYTAKVHAVPQFTITKGEWQKVMTSSIETFLDGKNPYLNWPGTHHKLLHRG